MAMPDDGRLTGCPVRCWKRRVGVARLEPVGSGCLLHEERQRHEENYHDPGAGYDGAGEGGLAGCWGELRAFLSDGGDRHALPHDDGGRRTPVRTAPWPLGHAYRASLGADEGEDRLSRWHGPGRTAARAQP